MGRICTWWWPDSLTSSSSQEQSRPSRPLRQSVGSLLRLSGWQSLRHDNSTSAVTLQSAGSLRVWDCKRGKTSSRPTREVKGACSGCWSRPCLFSKAKVSSSAPPLPSRSCCSSRANCRCAPHRPRRALRRYSSRRAYALLWFPQTARRRSASSTGFFVSNVRIWKRKTHMIKWIILHQQQHSTGIFSDWHKFLYVILFNLTNSYKFLHSAHSGVFQQSFEMLLIRYLTFSRFFQSCLICTQWEEKVFWNFLDFHSHEMQLSVMSQKVTHITHA